MVLRTPAYTPNTVRKCIYVSQSACNEVKFTVVTKEYLFYLS